MLDHSRPRSNILFGAVLVLLRVGGPGIMWTELNLTARGRSVEGQVLYRLAERRGMVNGMRRRPF